MPTKTWAVGEEVLSADFNTMVQQQVVATFPNTAARDTWATPPNGAMCVTTDTNQLWQRVAGVWIRQGAGHALGYTEFTGSSGPATGTAVYTGMSLTISSPGGRKMRLSGIMTMTQTGGPSPAHLEVREGVTMIYHTHVTMSPGFAGVFPFARILTPSAGTHTYDTFFHTDVGSIQLVPFGPDYAAHIIAEDMGL